MIFVASEARLPSGPAPTPDKRALPFLDEFDIELMGYWGGGYENKIG